MNFAKQFQSSGTADVPKRICRHCGREFTSFGSETSCGLTDCGASILDFPGEPYEVKIPIPVIIKPL